MLHKWVSSSNSIDMVGAYDFENLAEGHPIPLPFICCKEESFLPGFAPPDDIQNL